MTLPWYYSKTGCDGMGMCCKCKKKTLIGWRNVWNMKWSSRPRGRPKRTCAKRLSSM